MEDNAARMIEARDKLTRAANDPRLSNAVRVRAEKLLPAVTKRAAQLSDSSGITPAPEARHTNEEPAECAISMQRLLDELGLTSGEDGGDLVFDLRPAHGEGRVRFCQGRSFLPVALVSGWYSDGRTTGEVEAELPADFTTREEGLAWLAHASKPLFGQSPPDWLQRGLAMTEHLPWVGEKRLWDARPRCVADRPWLRLAAREIRASAAISSTCINIRWMFDGITLLVDGYRLRLSIPAHGAGWPSPVEVPASSMRRFGRRLLAEQIEISVWKGKLMCGRDAFELADTKVELARDD